MHSMFSCLCGNSSHLSFFPSIKVVAILIAVYTQNDFFDGLWLWVNGYKCLKNSGNFDYISFPKYFCAVFFQIATGLIGLFVTFILVMQSKEVVDLLLSFTAMEFVAMQDETVFSLAARGFLGRSLRAKAKRVQNTKYTINPVSKKKKVFLRLGASLLCFSVLLGGLGLIANLQSRRKIGDNDVIVQMSDAINPEHATLSGHYFGCAPKKVNLKSVGPCPAKLVRII
mmetsp:Transcript_5491/g.8073  ORF Transcript_5491/g.8073 Transcript_5491/m.8073 type:complete len:227 (+) Transcript_5491:555-1235(+)